VAEYGGRVKDDDAWYKRAVEDERIRGARAVSYQRKFTPRNPRKYLLLTPICLSYTGAV
jgi:hypothetical protein